jgi:DNA-binding response OmpR family regulator
MGQGLRVLLVEDDPDVAMLVRVLLERSGHAVEAVETAGAAIRALEERPLDVVVLDLALPDGDGLQAMPAARAAGVPVLVASAHAGQDHVERALAAGAGEFVRKPFTRQALEAALGRVSGRSTTR